MEEHTVFAKKLLYRLIYGVVAVQLLLLAVDRFPVGLSLLSVVSHGIYAQNLRRFPIVKLTDPLFLLSCGMLQPGRIAANAMLIVASPRNSEPLPLVPSLQRPTSQHLLLVPLFARCEYPHFHRDRIVLWTLCLARPFRSLRVLVRRRERSSFDGFRVRDRRWKQLHNPRKGTRNIWKRVGRWSRRGQQWHGGKEAGKERDECGHGKGCCHRCQRVGWRDWRGHGTLERRKDKAYFLKAGSTSQCMIVQVMDGCYFPQACTESFFPYPSLSRLFTPAKTASLW